MEIVIPQEDSSGDSIWDKPVPYVVKDRCIDCYITGAIAEPYSYIELCHLLDTRYGGDIVTIHINTNGGIIDSAFQIMESMTHSKAFIKVKLYGTVASAGTMIAMYADELYISPFTQFMIHNYSGGTQGKGHEVRDYVKFSDVELNKAFNVIYKDFLTPEEIDSVIEGKDIWLSTEEVQERWNNKVNNGKDT